MTPRSHSRVIRHIDLASVQLASSETARRINREIVLELVRTSQPISRADLARRSGLQRSTVSQIVEQLIHEQWVVEGQQATSPRGRRPTMLNLNADLMALAVDIHPGQATLAVVDLSGQLHARATVALTTDPVPSTQLLIDSLERLRETIAGKTIEGIGLSLPGRVEPATSRLVFAPNLRWAGFELKETIEKRMRLPVSMENAATASLLAEFAAGHLPGVRDAVLVSISEGVGTGICAGGQFITGSTGMAGEFGHVPIDPNGPECACGRRGCWEVFASTRAALRYHAELNPEMPAGSFHELLRLADEGDARATTALDRQAAEIGRGLCLVTAVLSPAVILISGDATPAWRHFYPVIERDLARLSLAGKPPQVLPSHEGEIGRLRGAAALVFQRRPAE